jgi:hypothetical protein
MKQFCLKSNQIEKFIIILSHHSLFLGHVMRRGSLENIVRTGKLKRRRDLSKQCDKMLYSLTAWYEIRSKEGMFGNMFIIGLYERHDLIRCQE